MATAAAVIPAPVPEGTPKRASGTNASIGGAGAISRGKDTGGKGSAASSTGRSVNTSQRKNFKERLHSAIQEGDAAQELPGAHLQDEMSACVSLLMEGCPESFVTFFNIVHEQAGHDSRRPRSSKLSKTLPKAASALPRAKYPLIKQQLTVAETAARAGDYETCYGCYMTLGKLFDQQGNLRRAVFFYHKCLDIAQDLQWVDGQLEAAFCLGYAYEHMVNPVASIQYYEACQELAVAGRKHHEAEEAAKSLVTVYRQQAKRLEADGETDGAIESYERCLKAAKAAKELDAAGAASQQIARLYQAQDMWQEALVYYKNFLELARVNRDKAAEGRACCAVAACQQKLGDTPAAIKTLEAYLSASLSPDLYSKAVAASNVGLLFYSQKMYDHATSYFERSYEAAKALGDRKLLNTARFNLGVSRGSLNLGAFVDVLTTDLAAVLDWKIQRRPFLGGQFAA